jgi:predicted phosphodiesterase
MIYVTGDTHIPHDINKLNSDNFPQQKDMDKNDYLIICGDFGGVWDGSKEELYWRKWLNDRSFTTLFVDGNHENFELLASYPVEEWNGGRVHKINDSVYHLMRGQVFSIDDGKKIFTMGGASSVDKENRIRGIDWWEEEIPNYAECEEGLINLEKNNCKVDYILSHTCSSNTLKDISKIFEFQPKPEDVVNKYLQEIEDKVKYKHWYFGHFHEDIEIDEKHTLAYNKIIRIL